MRKGLKCHDTIPFDSPPSTRRADARTRNLPPARAAGWAAGIRPTALLEASRAENLNTKLFLQGAAEAIFHLRTLVIRRGCTLVVRFRFDAQPNEIRARRRHNLWHPPIKLGQIIDGDCPLDAGAACHGGVIRTPLIDDRHGLDRLVALVVHYEMFEVCWLLAGFSDQATGVHA